MDEEVQSLGTDDLSTHIQALAKIQGDGWITDLIGYSTDEAVAVLQFAASMHEYNATLQRSLETVVFDKNRRVSIALAGVMAAMLQMLITVQDQGGVSGDLLRDTSKFNILHAIFHQKEGDDGE